MKRQVTHEDIRIFRPIQRSPGVSDFQSKRTPELDTKPPKITELLYANETV